MQNKKKSEYSKMIELQDKIEAECINNTELWVRSNWQTPPNQTRTTLTLTPFSISKPFPLSHSPSLNSTASSSSRTPMDSTSPESKWDAIDSAKKQ